MPADQRVNNSQHRHTHKRKIHLRAALDWIWRELELRNWRPLFTSEMSEPLNNGSHSGFQLHLLMISVMVQIIITGFEDFGLGSGFCSGLQF